jgi:hypothetical protein
MRGENTISLISSSCHNKAMNVAAKRPDANRRPYIT